MVIIKIYYQVFIYILFIVIKLIYFLQKQLMKLQLLF